MAKSSRASRIKNNKTKLANAVFRPVEEARLARLSEKVLAIANSSKEPIRMPGAMEIETEKEAEKTEVVEKEGGMDVDDEVPEPNKKKLVAKARRRGRASRHAVVFPGLDKKFGGKKSGGIRKGTARRSKK